ncbi:T6SS amidase immunity protein Tai4 family protein [Mangrovibacter phragmitis]|uniref:T6SS amidase immunity protein Tai4 family protein n=1 Tax=Mangrovibacter phragmitis TaxID=1691903 RepID=UPI003517B2A5
MKKLIILPMLLSFSAAAAVLPETKSFSQYEQYKYWVEARCIGKAFNNADIKKDANISAAAWLETSDLPVDAFNEADKLIDAELKVKLSGSVEGDYNILKCSLIANSKAVEGIFKKYNK